MNNKIYDILKWVTLIALPALSTLIATVGNIWGLTTDKVILTVSALTTFLGITLGISSYNYNTKLPNEPEDEINPQK